MKGPTPRPFREVLVTGAAGFLGSHLVETLFKRGHRVVGVDNFSTGLQENADFLKRLDGGAGRIRFVEADVTQPWSAWLPRIAQGELSHVLHFASPASPPKYQKIPTETFWANVLGLKEAVTVAALHGARVVFASSSEVYGDPETSPQSESYWGNVNSFGPRACYDEAKRAGEAILFSYNDQYGTHHGSLRIFNTYGPRLNPSDGRVIVNFLTQAHRSEPLTIYGDGAQTRSFCYVDDLIDGVLRYAETDLVEPLNLGSDKEFTILELADTVRRMFPDRELPFRFEPLPVDDPKRRRPDLTRARQRLAPWSPWTPLSKGLEQMSRWLRSGL